MPDPRVRHYWDPTLGVGRAAAPHIGLGSPAWDVWLLYDRDAAWGDGALPEPAWWEHQLGGLPADRHLDPTRFARKAEELLRKRSTPPPER